VIRKTDRPALAGLAIAIAITTTLDATGFAMFSALPLLPLTLLFWYLQQMSRAEMGLVTGPVGDFLPALLYPLLALGLIAGLASLAGAIDTADADWNKAVLNIALMSTIGIVMTLITEEAFFRGWLWASLRRAGYSERTVLLLTTAGFVLWHVPVISLDTGFDVPAREIPIYLVNASLLGAAWGILRAASGSLLVPSVCHAVWNGLDYPLFGFGERDGALGIAETHLYGPETGIIGIPVNALAVFLLVLWWRRRANAHAPEPKSSPTAG
jgi:membrane protease YdiL (CAAX protease family)